MLDDGHGCLLVGHEPFLQTLLVIIRPSTARLSSLQTARRADLLAALEEQDALQIDFFSHLLIPALQIVLVPWEAVDEEIVFVTRGHSSLQETAGDLHRNNCTVGNMMLYQLSKLKTVMRNNQLDQTESHLRPGLSSFCSQQVPSREVDVSEFLNDPEDKNMLRCPGQTF